MKSEERHQLAKNDLQVGINRWLDRIEPYSNHILGGIVVATIVAVGLIFWSRSSSAATEAGWSQMATANSADDFLRIAEEHPGSPAGNWARLQAARISYSNGIETALTDRKSSDESLKQAKDLFNDLVKRSTTPELRQEALKGLALTLEASSDGDVSEAIKAYEQFVKEFPDAPFSGYAAHRAEELKNPDAGAFYAWFHKQTPKPAERPLPNDGKPPVEGTLKTPGLPLLDDEEAAPPKADSKSPALPMIPETDGKSPPATPAAPPAETPAAPPATPSATPPASPPAETPAPAAPPSAPAPMPAPETPAPAAPMPEAPAPATPAPMPEPGKPADVPSLPSLPTAPETPKEP